MAYHEESKECNKTKSYAATWTNHPAIIMMDLKTQKENADYYWARMAYYLMHETIHTFGIEDRYEISSHLGNGYQCIMEAFDDHDGNYLDDADDADEVLLEFCRKIWNGECNAFCDTCANDVLEKLSE